MVNLQNPENQRAHERFHVTVAVDVQSAPGSEFLEGQSLTYHTRDISLTGMCLYTDIRFPVDTRLALSLELGSPVKTYNLLGKVIWSAPDADDDKHYRTGINLLKSPGDDGSWHNAVIQTLVG